MSPYTRRSIVAQLYCLALTLALLALPLAGIVPEHAPILTPLATELVPLGTSLQLPPTNPFHLPSLEAPARLVLGPSPSPAIALNPDSDGRLQKVASRGFSDSGAETVRTFARLLPTSPLEQPLRVIIEPRRSSARGAHVRACRAAEQSIFFLPPRRSTGGECAFVPIHTVSVTCHLVDCDSAGAGGGRSPR